MTELLKFKYFYIIFFAFISITVVTTNKISADQKIKITADEILVDQDKGVIKATGNAIANDQKGSKIKSDVIIYDEHESIINADGNIILNDIDGNTYFLDNLQSDDEIQNLKGTKIRARLDDGSRIVGSKLVRKEGITALENTEYTPCLENDYLIENCPGWKLKAKNIFQLTKKTIYYDRTRIHLFNVPILSSLFFSPRSISK